MAATSPQALLLPPRIPSSAKPLPAVLHEQQTPASAPPPLFSYKQPISYFFSSNRPRSPPPLACAAHEPLGLLSYAQRPLSFSDGARLPKRDTAPSLSLARESVAHQRFPHHGRALLYIHPRSCPLFRVATGGKLVAADHKDRASSLVEVPRDLLPVDDRQAPSSVHLQRQPRMLFSPLLLASHLHTSSPSTEGRRLALFQAGHPLL